MDTCCYISLPGAEDIHRDTEICHRAKLFKGLYFQEDKSIDTRPLTEPHLPNMGSVKPGLANFKICLASVVQKISSLTRLASINKALPIP